MQGHIPDNRHIYCMDHEAHQTKLEAINLWLIKETINKIIREVYIVGGELSEWHLGPVDFPPNVASLQHYIKHPFRSAQSGDIGFMFPQ